MIITLDDMLLVKEALWPDVRFYDKQVDVIESVVRDLVTVVPAGNELGKDFIAGFVITATFTICSAMDVQAKIVTSSATREHLDNLWGEIDFFIRTAKVPLTADKGGRLVYHPLGKEIGRVGESDRDGSLELETNSYVVARVVTREHKGEGLAGHHAPWNLFVADECSGMADVAYKMAKGWAQRCLFIGNPWPCENFFRRGVEAGDLVAA